MYILGIDVGTTGTKALAVAKNGRVAGHGYREYSIEMPADGQAVQNAEDWWQAVIDSVRDATRDIGKDIAAIGLSTQGASMLAVDGNFDPLCPVITWMDNRASKEAAELADTVGAEEIYKKSGWPLLPVFDAAKIAWIRRNWPDIYKKTASFVSTLEFINYRLTGQNIIDPTNAAIRQLMDIQMGKWDIDVLNAVGIDESLLPGIKPSGRLVGTLTPAASEALGLSVNTPVFNGAHDQYCAAIGSGVLNPGDMLLATGTTWVAFGVTKELLYTDSHISPGIFPLTGGTAAMASMVSAGSALKWFRGVIGADYAEIDKIAAERMHRAKDILFYPYIAGAGVFHPPGQKACITGFDMRHDQFDIARALMEGVAFEARLLLEEFIRHGMEINRLILTGGAAKSRLWSEITGYVTGVEIIHTKETEAACMGAAMMAAVGAGWYRDLNSCARHMVKWEPLPLEDERQRAFYQEKFERYICR